MGAKLAVGLIAAVIVAAGVATLFIIEGSNDEDAPAERRENPLGPTSLPPNAGAAVVSGENVDPADPLEAAAENAAAAQREAEEAARTDAELEAACQPTNQNLTATSLLPLLITAEVTGLGPGGVYYWTAPCLTDELRQRLLAPSLVPDVASPGTEKIAPSASCLLTATTDFMDEVEGLLSTRGAGSVEWTGAAFRGTVQASQTEFVSLAHDESIGVTTGTVNIGDGSREGSQQWIIEEGDIDFDLVVVPSESFGLAVASADWHGTAIDDLESSNDNEAAGNEAVGTVSFECHFFVAVPTP